MNKLASASFFFLILFVLNYESKPREFSMKYYALNMIKGHMNEVFFRNKTSKEEKKHFNELISIVHLNEVLGFNTIHIGAGSDIRNLFDEDQIEKINLYLIMKNKAFKIPDKVLKKANYTQNNVITFDYKSVEDITKARMVAMESPAYIVQKLKEEHEMAVKKALIASYGDVSDVDFDKKTYLAIDFEFNPTGKDKFHLNQITEIGLSYINGKSITTEHYIVTEHRETKSDSKKLLQDSFNFGVSQFISSQDVRAILESALTKSSILVFHEQSCDVRYFEHNKINLDNHKIYDTQMVYRNNLIPEGESDTGKKLKTFLDDNMIISKNRHNAGNDAHYTSMVFKAQVNNIVNNTKKLIKTQSIHI